MVNSRSERYILEIELLGFADKECREEVSGLFGWVVQERGDICRSKVLGMENRDEIEEKKLREWP